MAPCSSLVAEVGHDCHLQGLWPSCRQWPAVQWEDRGVAGLSLPAFLGTHSAGLVDGQARGKHILWVT